jgi:EAL domain-containing protein (putative c-di-GMP-specific phosphodiesterase class I)
MKIVIEGVETKDMAEQFSKLGCDYIQGYYFSKPIPKKEFIAFIKQQSKNLKLESMTSIIS